MGNGGTRTGPTKRGNWLKRAKQNSEALEALLEEYGMESVDQLKGALANVRMADVGEPAPIVTKGTNAERHDPLAFITVETPYVAFVSSTTVFTLRPGNPNLTPPMEKIKLIATGTGPWHSCPWYIGDRGNFVHDQNLKVFKANWWLHRLDKRLAESVWSDERFPMPKKAVLDPRDFRRWDRQARVPDGEMTELTEFVALREMTRLILQKGHDTFLDYGRRWHGSDWDPRYPNPYRNRITDVVREFKVPER